MTYQEALAYILSHSDFERLKGQDRAAHKFYLERMQRLLERAGNPHLGTPTVHIAGTKGKGSTAAMIASILKKAGYRTGLYISPHLHSFCERITIDGEPIPEEKVARLTEKIRDWAFKMTQEDPYGAPTTFELITALAFLYFAQERVAFQVIETGLGGRLDATNLVDPAVCVITSLSLDHTDVLGNTLEEIAYEKAGIIKAGRPVICAPQAPEAQGVIEATCHAKGAPLSRGNHEITWQQGPYDTQGQSFEVKGRLGTYELWSPLLGSYQLENAALAVGVMEVLGEQGFAIPAEALRQGMRGVSWPGRLQVVRRRPWVVVDSAHNPYSMQRLMEALHQFFRFRRLILVIGTSQEKDIAGMAAVCAPHAARVVATRSHHPRAAGEGQVAEAFQALGGAVQGAATPQEALHQALALARGTDLVCVTGSLFLVGEALALLAPQGPL